MIPRAVNHHKFLPLQPERGMPDKTRFHFFAWADLIHMENFGVLKQARIERNGLRRFPKLITGKHQERCDLLAAFGEV